MPSDAEQFAAPKPKPQKFEDNKKGPHDRELFARGGRIKTLEDLLEAGEVDLDVWQVDHYKQNTWEQNNKDEGIVTLFQVKAHLTRRAPTSVKPVRSLDKPLKRVKTKGRKAKFETALFMPDTQHGFFWSDDHTQLIPLHDYKAIDAFIQLAAAVQPDYVVLLGDHFDAAEWSVKYTQGTSHRETTQPALDVLRWHLVQLRLACPKAKLIWLEGNHDNRMYRAMIANMQAAVKIHRVGDKPLPVLGLEYLLKLDELDIEYVTPYGKTYWLWDKVQCSHGSSAWTEQEAKKATHSRINGHSHRVAHSTRTISTPNGPERISIVNPGTLARIDGAVPSAAVGKDFENWQQGAAIAHLIDGQPHFQVIPIENGKLVHDGHLIEGQDRIKQISKDTGWKQL